MNVITKLFIADEDEVLSVMALGIPNGFPILYEGHNMPSYSHFVPIPFNEFIERFFEDKNITGLPAKKNAIYLLMTDIDKFLDRDMEIIGNMFEYDPEYDSEMELDDLSALLQEDYDE